MEYDTPAGQFMKRIEIPYSYAPPGSTTPNPSQNNAVMDDEIAGPYDAVDEPQDEHAGATTGKKRNKVFLSAQCTLAARSNA